jgi:hypothetical protein
MTSRGSWKGSETNTLHCLRPDVSIIGHLICSQMVGSDWLMTGGRAPRIELSGSEFDRLSRSLRNIDRLTPFVNCA